MLKDKVDTVAVQATGLEVDYVIPYGREVNEALASVVCDCQIGNECHLMLIQWPTIHLVCSY